MKVGFFLRKKISQIHEVFRKVSYFYEYFFWFLFSKTQGISFPKKIKKILVVPGGPLGDTLYTLRTEHNLALNHPDKDFNLLVDESLYKNLKFLEKLTDVKLLTLKELPKHNFDLFLVISNRDIQQYSKKKAFYVGNDYSGILHSLKSYRVRYLNRKLFPSFKTLHYLEQQNRIFKLAKLNPKEISPRLNGVKITKKINKYLKKYQIKKFAVIHPGGRNFYSILIKNKIPPQLWPLDRYSQIADYLIKQYSSDIIITGTKEESFLAKQIIKHSKNKDRIFNLTGKLNIEDLFSLLKKSSILLVADTSLAHIAPFTNTPIVNLFGASYPELAGKFLYQKQIDLSHPETCVKCKIKGPCPEGDNICMKSIQVNEVENAIDSLLRK
jgi:ADP-heptose:LPS heptosyltransferase